MALQSALKDQLFSHGDVDEGDATKGREVQWEEGEKGKSEAVSRGLLALLQNRNGSLGLKPGSAEIGIFFVWVEN